MKQKKRQTVSNYFAKEDVKILDIAGVNLVVRSEEYENCRSRCTHHRSAAIRQAREVYTDLVFLKRSRNDAQPVSRENPLLFLSKVLRHNKNCVHCMCVALQLDGHFHCEEIAAVFLQRHTPLHC